MRSRRVVTGLERLLAEEPDSIEGRRLGLVANATSVDAVLGFGPLLLKNLKRARLSVLFGPEHGLHGQAQDQIEVGDSIDSLTGLPVRSLYGREFPIPECWRMSTP